MPLVSSTWCKVDGIQFITNSTTVSDQYRVSTDPQSPGIGIGIGTEKVRCSKMIHFATPPGFFFFFWLQNDTFCYSIQSRGDCCHHIS